MNMPVPVQSDDGTGYYWEDYVIDDYSGEGTVKGPSPFFIMAQQSLVCYSVNKYRHHGI